MKTVRALCVTAPTFFALRPCAKAQIPRDPTPIVAKTSPAGFAAGKVLYEAACSRCHGLDGGGSDGPSLQGVAERLGDTEIAKGNPENGKAVYDSSGCAGCHIVNGKGTGIGPELTRVGAMRGPSYFRTTLLTPGAILPKEAGAMERGHSHSFFSSTPSPKTAIHSRERVCMKIPSRSRSRTPAAASIPSANSTCKSLKSCPGAV